MKDAISTTAARPSIEAFPSSDRLHLIHARAPAVHNPVGGLLAAGGIGEVGGGSEEAPHPRSESVPFLPRLTRFADALIASASRALDLVRVSFTVPREREDCLVTLMHDFAAEVASAGAGYGAWLVLDRRPQTGAPHVYGLVLVGQTTKATLVRRWCEKTGADPNAHRGRSVLVSVRGWAEYAQRRNARSLRRNLLGSGTGYGVLTYGVKPLPNGAARDLDGDEVATSGALAAPWRGSSGAGEGAVAPVAGAHVPAMSAGVPRRLTCEVCGGSLSGKRADAKTCSTTCRMRKRDRRKPSTTGGTPPSRSCPTTPARTSDTPQAGDRRSSADLLLALVRTLLRAHGRAPFTSAQAHAAGRGLGVPLAEVDTLLVQLAEDGAADQVGGGYAFTPPHRIQ